MRFNMTLLSVGLVASAVLPGALASTPADAQSRRQQRVEGDNAARIRCLLQWLQQFGHDRAGRRPRSEHSFADPAGSRLLWGRSVMHQDLTA
jgi:hypothetical protein